VSIAVLAVKMLVQLIIALSLNALNAVKRLFVVVIVATEQLIMNVNVGLRVGN